MSKTFSIYQILGLCILQERCLELDPSIAGIHLEKARSCAKLICDGSSWALKDIQIIYLYSRENKDVLKDTSNRYYNKK